jgi:hypothetical protein
VGTKYHICDMCGTRIERTMPRYVLNMSVFAAYETLEITASDLARNYEEEIKELIEKIKKMDPKQLEEDIAKQLHFDLCRACHQKFLKDPLGNQSESRRSSSPLPPFDVDEFLRKIRDK